MRIYITPSLHPCRVNSWNSLPAPNSWTQNCLFLRFQIKVFRPNTSEVINAKSLIMVMFLNLIHRLTL